MTDGDEVPRRQRSVARDVAAAALTVAGAGGVIVAGWCAGFVTGLLLTSAVVLVVGVVLGLEW